MPKRLELATDETVVEAKSLMDSRPIDSFINRKFVSKHNLKYIPCTQNIQCNKSLIGKYLWNC